MFSRFLLANFPHTPTDDQLQVVAKWSEFLSSDGADDVFLLRGYAGTGKTSLVGALVKTMTQMGIAPCLLAPTGRAAKVFAAYASTTALTIHKQIYRQREFSPEMNNFVPMRNAARRRLFIVDEASMISNEGYATGRFGTGCVLDDLVHYVYGGLGCRLMLVGDTAQLPPVGEEIRPALAPEMLDGYGLRVWHHPLTDVVRQESQSGILITATMLRRMLSGGGVIDAFPRLRLMADVSTVRGDELIERLEQSYYECGRDETIVVTRSNKRANVFNNGIRGRILDLDPELTCADRLIVVKNNYHWTAGRNEDEGMPFVANGDMAEVRAISNRREEFGFHFADATLYFPDYDEELDLTILTDTLMADAPALTQEQQRQLFDRVVEDYKDIANRRKRLDAVKHDPHYNALQVKYAYAVTCHKAQGGQWAHVYIDQGFIAPDMLTPDYLRWLYTAITRATQRIFLINWPEAQILEQ